MVSKPCGSVTTHCLSCSVLGVEHHHQPAGADQRLLLLDHDGDEQLVGGDADHVGVAQEVDVVGEQEAQRRLRQRIEILGRELAVAHHHRRAVGDDIDRARRVVFEADLAGLLDVELALGAAAVGADLGEGAGHRVHARQVAADLVDQRALLRIEIDGRSRGWWRRWRAAEERRQPGRAARRGRLAARRARRRHRSGRRRYCATARAAALVWAAEPAAPPRARSPTSVLQ